MFRINFLWGISLTVFNSHHSTFKAKKRIKLTYSCASKGRVQEKQGFWKKYLVPFMAQGRFFSKPERLDLVFPLRTRSTFALE